jgi:Transposase zinc-binding domain
VLSAIERCRTAELGGHLDVCRSCGHKHRAYNSCRNRHRPKCQALRQEQWIAARAERVLPVRHFHVVFTMPRELRSLTKALPRPVLAALFSAHRVSAPRSASRWCSIRGPAVGHF